MKMNILKHSLIYSNPLKNVPQLIRNIKYAYQRVTRGYSDADVWSLDTFLCKVLSGALNQLADTGYTWCSIKFSTPEEWRAYLKDMALHFSNCLVEGSEYDKKSDEFWERLCEYRKTKSSEGNMKSLSQQLEDKDLELIQLQNDWLNAEKEASQFREQEKNLACDMLKEVFFSLWD